MTDRSERCSTCGRLALALADGFCSARCAELAARGYRCPAVLPELAAPPRTTIDCHVLVDGEPPQALPEGCVRLGPVDGSERPRELLRLGADDWASLEERLALLRDTVGSDRVVVLATQQFVPGGLRGPGVTSTPVEGCSA